MTIRVVVIAVAVFSALSGPRALAQSQFESSKLAPGVVVRSSAFDSSKLAPGVVVQGMGFQSSKLAPGVVLRGSSFQSSKLSVGVVVSTISGAGGIVPRGPLTHW